MSYSINDRVKLVNARIVDEDQNWSGLFKIGATSALVIVLVYLAEIVAVVLNGLPPTTVEGWFALLQRDRLVGLIQSFALDIIAVSCHVPLYMALFFYLKQARKAYATLILAVVFAFIGLAVYFASNITFSMLYLSDQFVAATTEVQKSQILTSGQTLLAIYNGTGPFVAFFLNALAGILVSMVMLRTHLFARWIAIAGIVGNALELGLPPSIDPAFFLQIDPILIGVGGVILLFWYAALAVKFYQVSLSR
jgi:hypothetical protein